MKKRGFVTIVGIILALLVLAGAAYLLLSERPAAKGQEVELGSTFTLKEGEFADVIDEGLRVKVTGFINSPCPEDAQCIWEGQAVKLSFTKGGKTEEGVGLLEAFGYSLEIAETDYETEATLIVTSVATGSKGQLYTNKEGSFELTYPNEPTLVLEKGDAYPPHDGQTKVEGEHLVHYIPLEHCNSRGDACDPRTANVKIGFFVLAEKFESIQPKLDEDFESKEKLIGGREATVIEMGAEGEGMTTYYIPAGEKTVLITETYIDETVVASYEGKAEFIPRTEQRAIFEKIINTLVWSK